MSGRALAPGFGSMFVFCVDPPAASAVSLTQADAMAVGFASALDKLSGFCALLVQ